jgi:HK97 family phage portal protein
MPLIRNTVASLVRRAPETVVGLNDGLGRMDLMSLLMGRRSTSGGFVDEEKAFTISAVYRAIDLIASVSASLPIYVYQQGEVTRTRVRRPEDRYLWKRPNPEVNRWAFWATVFLHLAATGNAFVYVVAAPGMAPRRPAELWPIESSRVQVGRANGEKVYLIDGVTPEKDWLRGGRIWHLMGLSRDGLVGMSPMQLGLNGFGLALAAEEYGARFFANGSAPGGYLSSEQVLSAAQAKELSDMWEEFHRGVENAHRTAVVGRGTKWLSTALNPEDAQLLLTRQFSVSEVARWWGVPEHLLSAHDKQSSWGTGIAENNRAFLTYTIEGKYLTNTEQSASDELLPDDDLEMAFDRAGLLRGNPLEEAQYLEIMRRNGAINVDEWRDRINMPPLPGSAGQEYLVPLNMGPAGSGDTGGAA